MIGNLIHVGAHFLHVPVLSQIDLAPLTLPITGVAWAWALFRFRLLEVMPVARQAIMEEMGDGIVVVDIENCVIYANPAMLTLLARPASKVIGQPAANVLPPWLHLPVSDRHAASSQEEVVVPDDENARHFDRRTLRLENSRGRPTGWMTLVRDITQRKQAEIQRRNALEAQRQSEQRFRKIFEGAQIGVVMINQHGAIQAVNPFMCQWLGYSKAAMQSLTTEDITYPPDIPRERRLLQEMRHGERNVVHLEKRYVRSDGEIVWGDLVTNLVYDEEDHYLFGLGTVVDVTDRKQAQQRLEAYAAELKRSNEELEQFGYVVSHDLREPLRMVASYLELLETRYGDTLEERAKVYMDFAVDGARRMQAMIKALLDLSRVETRGNPFTRVDAGAILTRTLTSLSPMIEENQAVITHDPLPSVAADEAQLAQVFQNLIVNAIKFQREGVPPRIHISADRLPPSNSSPGGEDSSSAPAGEITGGSPDGGEWRFSVTDNGIGIDPEQADRLFRIFQRLHTADEYPGLGLGLALCKRIITRHGGRIWIESEPGEGATFVFTIPTQRKDL
jgi:PAS domain S-box-containing protein